MFVEAIEVAAQFTRPIHSIVRYYRSTDVHPAAATLFFVNADGWALTCKHVAQNLAAADQMLQRRNSFMAELAAAKGTKKEKQILRELERKYNLSSSTPFELHNNFVDCIEGTLQAEVRLHPELDVALIHFEGYKRLHCTSFPTFGSNGSDLKQGKFLCRLGFPFPEFSNFRYDPAADSIEWTQTGQNFTPRFPIEGMLTRHLGHPQLGVVGFEMSTPGLKGQSGGPAFDRDGRVWGMQAATGHLDLDFDVNQEVVREGQKKRVRDSAFLHVGHCVHVDVLKAFMKQHSVTFQEG